MNRFSKGAVLNRLEYMIDWAHKANWFDMGDGWAQLRRHPNNTADDVLIQRAVEYGKWRAYQTMAEIIRSGDI